MLLGALQGGFQVFRSAFRDPASGLVEVFIAGVYRGGGGGQRYAHAGLAATAASAQVLGLRCL